MSGEQRKFELSVPQIAGSALAAVTAAVAASYLGVGGTVIGAALMSVASTVATAVYTHYLKRTGDKVKQHTVIAWREYGAEQPPPRQDGDEGRLAMAVHATVRESEAERPGESTLVMAPIEVETRRRVPWVKTGVAAALVFGVSMGGILAYQTIAQTTVHDQLTGTKPATKRGETPAKEKKGSEEPAFQPRTTFSGAPATPSGTPTGSPTPTASPTRSSQSPTPTPTGTGKETGRETGKETVEPSSPAVTTTAQDPGDVTEETSVPTDLPQSPPVQQD